MRGVRNSLWIMTGRGSLSGRGAIELVVVLCLAASTAFVLVPVSASRGIVENEDEAARVLREIAGAQVRFRAAAVVDPDGDGTGAYGSLTELAGIRSRRVSTPWTDGRLEGLESEQRRAGLFRRAGYYFTVYLCDGNDTPVTDPDAARPDFWVGYAWPVRYGDTGRRVYSIDAQGHLRYWDNELPYSGTKVSPPAWLAPKEALPDAWHRRQDGWQTALRWRDA